MNKPKNNTERALLAGDLIVRWALVIVLAALAVGVFSYIKG